MWWTSLCLSLLLGSAPAASPPSPGFAELKGFKTVVLAQIESVIGSDNLPVAMGHPVEPGVYVTLSQSRSLLFDREGPGLNGGRLADRSAASECQSGCPAAFYDFFRAQWLGMLQESIAVKVDLPSRVHFATEAKLPARTLIEAAYAVAESRPKQPPSLYLLLNAKRAGLRAKPFHLLPPKGITRTPGDRLLGLKVHLDGGMNFRMSAIDPRFDKSLTGAGTTQLEAILGDIKRHYPGKDTLIIDIGDNASMDELVAVIRVAEETFPRVVLTVGS